MSKREVVKRVKNAVLYSDGLIRIDDVRASYPHLDKAWAKNEGETPKFSVTGIMPKKTHMEAQELCNRRIDELLKENKQKRLASDKKFIRDGDLSDKEEYEDAWTVSASEDRRPSVRGRKGEVLTPDEILNLFYAGCRISMLVRPWYQDNQWGKRVNAGLIAVRFMADDEPIGEGRITDEDIDDYYDDFDDFDDDDGFDDDDL